MNRRAFLKWLLSAAAVTAASAAGLRKLLEDKSAGGPPSAATPDAVEPAATAGTEAQQVARTGGALLSFFILSDLHINPDLPERSAHLKKALDDIKTFGPEIHTVLMTGDNTDYGRDRDYAELQGVLKTYKLPPLHANMGNHDYYRIWFDKDGTWNTDQVPNGRKDAESREAFKAFFKYDKTYHDAWESGYHIIMLSQDLYQQEKPEVGEGAWYSDDQLAWLKERLAETKDGKPIFIGIHQPLPPAGSDGGSHQLIRAKAFRSILKPYPNVFVFSGHQHQDFRSGTPHYVKETFHWFHNSSVGRVLNRKYQNQQADAAQGLYVQVFADRVVVRGRQFDTREWVAEADWKIPIAQSKV